MKVFPDIRLGDTLDALRYSIQREWRELVNIVNGQAEGRIQAVNGFASVPTAGQWSIGDFVRNSAPVEAGSGGSKYVVTGWIRVTDGSGNVLNTDWLECRALTGN